MPNNIESTLLKPHHAAARAIPEALLRPTVRVAATTGLDDRQPDGWERRDPSNVLNHQGRFLLWDTARLPVAMSNPS